MEKFAISVPEAAKALGISKSMAYQLIHRADFPVVRIGSRILVSVKGLEKWVEDNTGGVEEE